MLCTLPGNPLPGASARPIYRRSRMTNTHQSSEEVFEILKKAAYFSIFSVPDPNQLSEGIPLIPFIPASIYKIRITEAPHRHQLAITPPTADCGFRSRAVGSNQQVARQRL